MSTAITTVDRDKVVGQLRSLVEEYGPAALEKIDHFGRAFRLADGVQKFRHVVTEAMPLIRPLQGSALGFLTDRDKSGGYPNEVIAECATEALMRGLTLHGNQWNIIGGRCYVTKEGMRVIVGNLSGLTDLTLSPSIPQFTGIGAVLDFAATWKMHGQPQSLTRKIVVKAQAGQVDLAIGKATRKMLAAIYERITGSAISDGEIDDPPAPPRQVEATALPASPPPPPPAPKTPAAIIKAIQHAETQKDFDSCLADARDNWRQFSKAQQTAFLEAKSAASTRFDRPDRKKLDHDISEAIAALEAATGRSAKDIHLDLTDEFGVGALADMSNEQMQEAIEWLGERMPKEAVA